MARTKEACQEEVGSMAALWTLWGNVVNLAEKRFEVGLESRFSKKPPARSKCPGNWRRGGLTALSSPEWPAGKACLLARTIFWRPTGRAFAAARETPETSTTPNRGWSMGFMQRHSGSGRRSCRAIPRCHRGRWLNRGDSGLGSGRDGGGEAQRQTRDASL